MDYYQGYEDGMRHARVTRGGLLGFVIRASLSVLYSAFIYVPLIIISYALVQRISHTYSNDIIIKIGMALILCYLLFAGIYVLKGVLIALRQRHQALWFALFLVCVAMTSGVQAIATYSMLDDFFAARNVVNKQLWSGLGAGLIGILIYSHYQFLNNVSPRIVFWSYQLGYAIAQTTKSKDEGLKAHSSKSYFTNAPMKVSYRK